MTRIDLVFLVVRETQIISDWRYSLMKCMVEVACYSVLKVNLR
jgi:hypothetical protein